MSEAQPSSLRITDWDGATKLASLVALLAGAVWTLWTYHDAALQQARSSRIEAQKTFSAKRLDIYDKLANLASAVAQSDLPPDVRKKKRQEMDQVVNGPLALVAQDTVFLAVREFYTCLDKHRCAKGNLALYSRDLARACRSSLEESRGVSLSPVPTSDTLP